MKRLYLGNGGFTTSPQRFDLEDRLLEHAQVARMQVGENLENGWVTTIDIPIPNTSIFNWQSNEWKSDPEDNSPSGVTTRISILDGNRIATTIGRYGYDGYESIYDMNEIDLFDTGEVYFGEHFMWRGLGKVESEDQELFGLSLERLKMQGSEITRNSSKER